LWAFIIAFERRIEVTRDEQLKAEIKQIRLASTEMYSKWADGEPFDRIYISTLLSYIHGACDEISKLTEA
ncbi:MAG: hypothetical protein K2H85_00455, partial [Allobaculum sp.]|nr:hypothetical protein [Allobaculum sp.]